MNATVPHKPRVAAPDIAWLAQRQEDAIEPELPVIDAHHHLWDFSDPPYFAADFARDAAGGHNFTASVFVECTMGYRDGGPPELRPVGETEFVVAQAEKVSTSDINIAAAIVGMADLEKGDRIDAVLDAHIAAGKGRFRGIRARAAWDADPDVSYGAHGVPKGLMREAGFRDGVRRLAAKGLSLDLWAFHTQLKEVSELADAHPEATIILNHIGGPLGIGSYRDKRKEVFEAWALAVRELARRNNVVIKIGGIGIPRLGWLFPTTSSPPSSDDLAAIWSPYVETCIEAFGADRSMFESNFPVDKAICSMTVLLNAYKKMITGSDQERRAIFYGTAAKTYRIDPAGMKSRTNQT